MIVLLLGVCFLSLPFFLFCVQLLNCASQYSHFIFYCYCIHFSWDMSPSLLFIFTRVFDTVCIHKKRGTIWGLGRHFFKFIFFLFFQARGRTNCCVCGTLKHNFSLFPSVNGYFGDFNHRSVHFYCHPLSFLLTKYLYFSIPTVGIASLAYHLLA